MMAGTGVRAADALEEFREVVRQLGIPVTTAWTHDLIATDDPLFCGRPGHHRRARREFHRAERRHAAGARIAPEHPAGELQLAVVCAASVQDAGGRGCRGAGKAHRAARSADSLRPEGVPAGDAAAAARIRLSRASVTRVAGVVPRARGAISRGAGEASRSRGSPLNPYHFIEQLFAKLADDDVVVCGNAAACIVPYQAARLKAGQRLISNSGAASMGYDLPAAIGAAVAREGKRVICLAGDGSIQLNIQELQTIVASPTAGEDFRSGQRRISFHPADAGELFRKAGGRKPGQRRFVPGYGQGRGGVWTAGDAIWKAPANLALHRRGCSEAPGPALCHVRLDPAQEFEPRLKSRQLPDGTMVSPDLEDMYPFLPSRRNWSRIVLIGQEAGEL